MNTLILKVLLLLSFVFMIYVNVIANTKPIGGNTTGDISDKYPTMFTPSGFTFSIWGLIYLLLGVLVITSFIIPKENITSISLNLYNGLLIGINVFNMFWLLSWHNDKILLSTIVMIGMLSLLLVTLIHTKEQLSIPYVTLSIYSGWISVALIANISILIVKYDISLFMNHQLLWLIIILLISASIGGFMAIKKQYYIYSSVYLWAYIGILARYI